MAEVGFGKSIGEACRGATDTQTPVIPFLLIIFTESLWYPLPLDPVRGDAREVSFKRESEKKTSCLTAVLLYSETCQTRPLSQPRAQSSGLTNKQKKIKQKMKKQNKNKTTVQRWKTGSQLQRRETCWETSQAETTVPTRQCSPMLDCAPS